MKALRERSPAKVGVVGLSLLLAALAVTYNARRLPLIGDGPAYRADFTQTSGLRAGEEVRVAGIKVGTVSGIALDGTHVVVTFRVKGVRLGTLTRADIKIKTLLGAHYLALEPAGPGRLAGGAEIPLSRTTAAFDVVPAFSGLARDLSETDTAQLAKAFTTLADTFRGSAPEIRSTLRGLSRLSATVASRDDDLRALLRRSSTVTGVLAQRRTQITGLVDDANAILGVLDERSATIDSILVGTRQLATEVLALVADNRAHLAPALAHLQSVVDVLTRDRAQISDLITSLAPFATQFSSIVGSGEWFDTTLTIPPDLTVCDSSSDPVLRTLSGASCLPLGHSR